MALELGQPQLLMQNPRLSQVQPPTDWSLPSQPCLGLSPCQLSLGTCGHTAARASAGRRATTFTLDSTAQIFQLQGQYAPRALWLGDFIRWFGEGFISFSRLRGSKHPACVSCKLLPAACQDWLLETTCSQDFSFSPMEASRACKDSGRGLMGGVRAGGGVLIRTMPQKPTMT